MYPENEKIHKIILKYIFDKKKVKFYRKWKLENVWHEVKLEVVSYYNADEKRARIAAKPHGQCVNLTFFFSMEVRKFIYNSKLNLPSINILILFIEKYNTFYIF